MRDQVKIVAHTLDGKLIKGFPDASSEFVKDARRKQPTVVAPDRIPIKLFENGKAATVNVQKMKAVFFVKSFEGQAEYNELKFFKSHPLLEGLWVRLTFADGEATEGVVYNSMHHLVNPGFFLKPPDPQSNNELVYVLKSSLKDFRILGVRNSF